MVMSNCSSCCHWSKSNMPPGQGSYPDNVGICLKISSCHTSPDEAKPAYTLDAEDYFSAFICRDDFGCTLHDPEPKAYVNNSKDK